MLFGFRTFGQRNDAISARFNNPFNTSLLCILPCIEIGEILAIFQTLDGYYFPQRSISSCGTAS
jgi:hypothetical protein